MKNLLSKYWLFIIGGIVLIPLIIYAAQSYRSDPGTAIMVNEYSVCKKVVNSGSNSYFIPTNTLAEWQSFISADSYLADISLGACGPCGGIASITDTRDTNNSTYNTVEIGTQCWLARNENVGTRIAGTINQTNNAVLEKYCYSNTEANCATDGGLYQWDEAMQYTTTEGAQGICPTGWHIPKDSEQYTLENYLKITGQTCNAARDETWECNDAGTKLKSGGSSGFNAPLAGSRIAGGVFTYRATYAHLWSSTQYAPTYAWNRYLGSSAATVGRYGYNFSGTANGFSVRCLKN